MSSLLSSARPWRPGHALFKEDPGRTGSGGLPGALIAAVAAIVGIAAEKARRSGHMGALREAIEAALGPASEVEDPREKDQQDLPRIADADPVLEAARLGALAARG
jgi:hypothetical protein